MNADQKKKADAIWKRHKQLSLTIQVLDSDVNFAVAEWRKNPEAQFWRRTLVRCCCSSVEGSLSLLKNVSIETAEFLGVPLTEKDIEVATERRTSTVNGVRATKPAFLPFPENVKSTFKLFAKAHAVQAALKFDVPAFKELCGTYDLRSKLMHPKGVFDLQVNDAAINAAKRGLQWFRETLGIVSELSAKKLPFSRETFR